MPIVLGAGVSGLAVGMASGAPVFEAADGPGGLCSSYYVRPDGSERSERPPADGEAYRFELGGGHWIFGGDPDVYQESGCATCAIAGDFRGTAVGIEKLNRAVEFFFP